MTVINAATKNPSTSLGFICITLHTSYHLIKIYNAILKKLDRLLLKAQHKPRQLKNYSPPFIL